MSKSAISMNYHTIDWEAEAARVAKAFGVVGECRWYSYYNCTPKWLQVVGSDSVYLDTKNEVSLVATVGERYFKLELTEGVFEPCTRCIFSELNGGRVEGELDYAEPMAKALYHLNLLTPEVEAALKVSISAHQKMEWTLEKSS